MNWSDFGHKLTARSGILELMDDLGKAMQSPGKKFMLGGGNPGSIPPVNQVWRRRMQEILANGDEFERGLGNYDTPQGKYRFLESMAGLLQREYGWNVGPENIGVTNGSQSAFFILFNLLSGQLDAERGQGVSNLALPSHDTAIGHNKILLPFTPEYIGYADQGIGEDHFVSQRPVISMHGQHEFKYQVDFSSLDISGDIGAICVSRPTNPTGNVLTDHEVHSLDALARKNGIPLMIDNAYGTPFPDIVFTKATPIWNSNIILGLSLSKLGLPSTRTGILVARPEVIDAVSAVNAITSLSNGTLGQLITGPMLDSGELLNLSREVIQPFYRERSQLALHAMKKHFDGLPWKVHRSEGALFLWVWFDHPDIDTFTLYQRLKERNVIIVPGKYFFYGLDNASRAHDDWPHRNQCFRMNFAGDPDMIDQALGIIADEVTSMLS
ncbi:valine--pyruvate transaminase [Spirochaeta africana]|uniref:Alanine-alpha-ketoisovalerate (Or valine-pyruvate) aminotransferase n=1 Tax=Spirochaeta africana (strain ATCC 700263 / DSM 8902 / Z-7692) TaxID=889378 RepID=H9UKZ1_SPIAZ|nr:valine--pyruvate transaminase [Spirochaeta africana]AFG38184.1 alanine-alpha-ketoisovalerate (or valine-pyruvate) aminotransferase [Spirochaeta africana DSM 8902]